VIYVNNYIQQQHTFTVHSVMHGLLPNFSLTYYNYVIYPQSPEPVIPPGRLAQIDLSCIDVPQNTNQSIIFYPTLSHASMSAGFR